MWPQVCLERPKGTHQTMFHRSNQSTIAAASLLLAGIAANAGDRDDLLALLSSTQRTSGEVHAIYVEVPTGNRSIAGYDFASGAWYKAFSTYTGGVDANGLAYAGRPVPGQVVPITEGPPRQFDTALEEHFPFVITRDFHRRPDLMRTVDRVGDLFRVTIRTPNGVRWMDTLPEGFQVSIKDATFWIDRRGLVVRADDYAGVPGRQRVWNYESPDSERWGIADSINDATRVRVELRTGESSDPSRFSMQEVEKLAVGAFLIADRQPLWFGKSVDAIVKSARAKRGGPQEYVAPGHTENPARAAGTGANTNKPAPRVVPVIDPPRRDRTQAYLAFGGMGMLACAGALWWWRRKG